MLPPLVTALFLSAVSAFSVAEARASEWWPYDNPHFGYSIELPPGFGTTVVSDRKDGLALAPADRSATLLVFATPGLDSSFSREAETRLALAKQDGWRVSYSKMTPQGFSYTGVRRERIVYGRGVALCNGASAFFQMDYAKSDMQRYDAVVMRLVRSLKSTAKCVGGGTKQPFRNSLAATG
ncbi:hypothetical protein [Rhizobium sp. HT1-10]|uniref:hypothetical protein n=1 Tax=Rhizobium sp. HT1-10 TaxID=3111638 RepID=UPI003C17DB07